MFIYFPPSLKATPYLLVWVTLLGVTRAATSRDQFKEWYPQYGWIFTTITHGNCSSEYNRYLTGKKNHSEIDCLSGGGIFTVLTQPLLDCILNHTSESLKSSMTSAQVLLGIMPTILAFLGPSHEELAMLANVGRRPLLAAGIALASPSAYFSRAFEYLDVKKILSRSRDRRPQWRPGRWQSKLGVVIVEYLVTTAACFNAINNTLQVQRWTICSVSSDAVYFPGLWLASAVMMHFFGCIVFRLRLQGWRRPPTPTTEKSLPALPGHGGPGSRKVYGPRKRPGVLYDVIESSKLLCKWMRETLTLSSIRGLVHTEFVPCASKGWRVSIKTRTETRKFLFCSWWESTFTILHLIFGTLVFSGTLFVGTKDATGILGRYIAGVAVCRVVLMYELAGLRENCNPMDGKAQRPDMLPTVEERTCPVEAEKIVPFDQQGYWSSR